MNTSNLYDLEEYPTHAYIDTHPSRLRTMAMLHGLSPAPVECCRVLEIGCNAGANLIPMAHALPVSEFVGFDLAALPVARGQEKIAALGLTNIRLLQADIMDAEQLPELAVRFDYIIAHGVYTWVSATVRDELLRFCGKHLSENGVAFISYAALPGGHVREITREILQLGGAEEETPVAKVAKGQALLELVAKARPEGDGFRSLLENELAQITKRGPQVVFHDEMAPVYQPVSLLGFAKHAAEHGLQHFSEAEFPAPNDPCFQPEAAAAFGPFAGSNALLLEQMLDFVRMRKYRESLLCRAEAPFTFELRMEALDELFIGSKANSAEGSTATARAYTLPTGIRIETEHPMTLQVLNYVIARSPEPVTYAELAKHLLSSGITPGSDLVFLVLRLVVSQMLDLHAWRLPVSRRIAEKPIASGLCRHDATTETQLVTPLHTTVSNTDPIARVLIPLLDGTRDHEALLRDLMLAVPEVPAETLAQGLPQALKVLNRSGMLLRDAGKE